PLLWGVGPCAALSSSGDQAGPTADPLPAGYPRRHLLRPAYRLPVALSARQLPTLAGGLLPFSALVPPGRLVPSLLRPACGRAEAGGRPADSSAAVIDAQSVKTV